MSTPIIKYETTKFLGIDVVYFKTFASAGIAGFVFLLTVIGLVIPKINEIGDMNNNIDKLERDIKDVDDKVRYLSTISQDTLRKNEETMLRAIPDSKDLYYIMSVVKQVALESSFTVDTFSVSPGEVDEELEKASAAGGKVNNTPLSVTLQGPQEKYLELLTGFEKALPIMSLDQFSMKQSGDLAEIRLTVGTYSTNRVLASTKEIKLSDVQLGDKEKKLIEELASYSKIEISSASAVLQNIDLGATKIDPFNL